MNKKKEPYTVLYCTRVVVVSKIVTVHMILSVQNTVRRQNKIKKPCVSLSTEGAKICPLRTVHSSRLGWALLQLIVQ